MAVGQEHVENPWILVGQIATVIYFAFFIVIVPLIGVIENTLMDVATAKASENTGNYAPSPISHPHLRRGTNVENGNKYSPILAGLFIPGVHVIPYDHEYSGILFITGFLAFIVICFKLYQFIINRSSVSNNTPTVTLTWLPLTEKTILYSVVGVYIIAFGLSLFQLWDPNFFNAGPFYIPSNNISYFERVQFTVMSLCIYYLIFYGLAYLFSLGNSGYMSGVSKRFSSLAYLIGNIVLVSLAIAFFVDFLQMIADYIFPTAYAMENEG